MRNGTLCPINIILSMLKREIRKHLENGKTKMLVDGPRSLVQLLGIEDEVCYYYAFVSPWTPHALAIIVP